VDGDEMSMTMLEKSRLERATDHSKIAVRPSSLDVDRKEEFQRNFFARPLVPLVS
jgi:hypothetical protein